MFRLGWRTVLGISQSEVTFERRRFPGGTPEARQHLEKAGYAFLHGYHAGLDAVPGNGLDRQIDIVHPELRGFVCEGMAMAFAMLDFITPWKRTRLREFLSGAGANHTYMVHVGAGWAVARLRASLDAFLAKSDRMLRWLIADGYGFHQGYFYWRRFVEGREAPKIKGYAQCAFDQGLGRSIWFVDGADSQRIPSTINAFPAERRADLWSGVGLACAYAGGANRCAIEDLLATAKSHKTQLAQGAAFAARARQLAGTPAPHTELACQILCHLSADAAADLSDRALADLRRESVVPAYESWRGRVRRCFAERMGVAL
jgi:enediyne biosynthesis protein E3